MHTRVLCTGFLLALTTIACGMGDERPPKLPGSADGGATTSDTGASTSKKKLQSPMVDPVSGTVCSDSVPLQGAAVPGASVFVVGGLATSGIAADAHPTTGRFCIDVPLKKGSINTLEVRAQDPVLGVSDPATVTVTHGGTCKDDVTPPAPDAPKSRNLALGLVARTSKKEDKGNAGFLTDGDNGTVAVYSNGMAGFYTDIWISLKLDKVSELDKVVVRWRDSSSSSDHFFGTQYKVLVSTAPDPGDPNLDNGYWTPIANVTDGHGGVDTFEQHGTRPLAQQVALWLQRDGSFNWAETFAISEIEVWDAPKQTTQPLITQTNTCANIGAK